MDGLSGPVPVVKDSRPLEIILVGDSTMAPNSGYGNALCERFLKEVTCLNLAKVDAVPVVTGRKVPGR
jgi:ribosomal protein L34E